MDYTDIAGRVRELFNIDLNKCKLLGEGHSGRAYLMPDGRVLKIFRERLTCIDEYDIYAFAQDNKHFPEVYDCRDNFLIREYVGGALLSEYINRNGLSYRLTLNLIAMIVDFEKLGFMRLDMRCGHIFVQENEELKIIDPRDHFTRMVPFPFLMMRGLKRLGVLDKFLLVLKEDKPDLYDKWTTLIK